ncbi:hypothetical protein ACH4S8_10840 [Streptomyces sp. NPDC021080]|uniref:hypothetical protein n=1 Tax=Streptomyces sp. NPDC021080 TaxID=3365110 RepID=UPI0037B8517A
MTQPATRLRSIVDFPKAHSARPGTRHHGAGNICFTWRETFIAVGIYLSLSFLGFSVLSLINWHLGHPLSHVLQAWDAENYLTIAARGYPDHLAYRANGIPQYSRVAFFPLVPGAVRLVHLVTGIPVTYAGIFVSWVGGAVAAGGIHTLTRSLVGLRAAYACVALWACSPYASILWIPYSEAVFTALVVWGLVALLARRWFGTGLMAAVAGTARPTASCLIAVVVLAAALALIRRSDGLRPVAAIAMAPLGLLGTWLYLGSRIGSATGWFEAEKAWNQSFDFGRGTLLFLYQTGGFHSADVRLSVVIIVIAATAIGVIALSLDRRVPWPLALIAGIAWTMMVSTPGAHFSKPRFMLPFMPILLMLPAVAVSRLRRPVRWLVYGSGAAFAGWYGAGLLILFWPPP